MNQPLLEIQNLSLSVEQDQQNVNILHNISMKVMDKEIVGLVGETGSGKSSLSKAIMRLQVTSGKEHVSGHILFEGMDLIKANTQTMESIRGAKIGMIFQDPLSALNPVITIGDQLIETIVKHRKAPKDEAFNKAVEILFHLGITHPLMRMHQYSYEISGGMRKRIAIAIAISCHPKLIIADESTSSLDVITESQVLRLLKNLDTSVLFISHDLHLTSKISDRIYVMYAGSIVETGNTNQIFKSPKHPYTQLLLASCPRLAKQKSGPLIVIPGVPPLPETRPKACAFHPRCPKAMQICSEHDPSKDPELKVPCWLYHPTYQGSLQKCQIN